MRILRFLPLAHFLLFHVQKAVVIVSQTEVLVSLPDVLFRIVMVWLCCSGLEDAPWQSKDHRLYLSLRHGTWTLTHGNINIFIDTWVAVFVLKPKILIRILRVFGRKTAHLNAQRNYAGKILPVIDTTPPFEEVQSERSVEFCRASCMPDFVI